MPNNVQHRLMIEFIERVALHPATCDSLRTEAIMLLGVIFCDGPPRELRRPNRQAG